MLHATIESLRERGEHLAKLLRAARPQATIDVEPSTAYPGGGSMPGQGIDSIALVVTAPNVTAEDLAKRLRTGRPAVVPTVKQDTVRVDLRTVRPHHDEALAEAIVAALC